MFLSSSFAHREVTGYWIVRLISPSLVLIHNFSKSQSLSFLQDFAYFHCFDCRALFAGILTIQDILNVTAHILQMHRHRMVAQISLILSILNLVLAAPVVVRKIHEARGDETVIAEDLAAMPKKWRELEAASYRSTSPRSSQPDNAMGSPQPEVGSTSSGPSQPEDTIASPQPEVESTSSGPSQPKNVIASPQPGDGPTSSGSSQHEDAMTSPQPEVGSTSSGPSQSKNAIASPQPEDGPTSSGSSQHEDAMASPQHSDGSESSGYPSPHLSDGSSVSGYSWLLDRPPRLSPNRPSSLHDSDWTSVRPNSGVDGMTFEEWWRLPFLEGWWQTPPSSPAPSQELAPPPHGPHPSSSGTSESEIPHPPPQLTRLGPATTEPEGLTPSHHFASDPPPPSPSSPPTETPPDNAKFFNEDMVKGLKVLAGGGIIGGAIGGIVGFGIIHHKSKDD